MALIGDITSTYRGPAKTLQGLLDRGKDEKFALIIAMVGCVVGFVAQWPRLSREAFISEDDIFLPLYSMFLGFIFVLPLILYALGFASHFIARLFGSKASGYGARLAIVWAFLAASPLLLLHGMVAGFIGQGPQLSAVGLLWFLVFIWFWISGLWQAEWGNK